MGLSDDDLERLTKLGELRASGVLSEEEFVLLKAQVFKRWAPDNADVATNANTPPSLDIAAAPPAADEDGDELLGQAMELVVEHNCSTSMPSASSGSVPRRPHHGSVGEGRGGRPLHRFEAAVLITPRSLLLAAVRAQHGAPKPSTSPPLQSTQTLTSHPRRPGLTSHRLPQKETDAKGGLVDEFAISFLTTLRDEEPNLPKRVTASTSKQPLVLPSHRLGPRLPVTAVHLKAG